MKRRTVLWLVAGLVLLMAVQPVLAAPAIGHGAFQRLWTRQDLPVAQGVSNRSWTWGPAPISEYITEPFYEGNQGLRSVQYFDKSRMEINDPTADPNATWYVTNGLLPVEMISGQVQVGFDRFVPQHPAAIAAVGDPGAWLTYQQLRDYYQSPGQVNPGDLGKPATGMLNPDGTITGYDAYANDPATILVRGENNHGVAKAFADYQTQRGLVYENGQYLRDQVYDPLFVFGLPVTGAYWVMAPVGGVERPILFQVFERRVLTYNPANPPAFRVEMGNVGQHYYQWRYGR